MKQTQTYVCTLEEFIQCRCSHIGWSEIELNIHWNYTGLYTNIWIDWKRHEMTLRCHWINCSWIGCEFFLENSWYTSLYRITIAWETVTLRSRRVKCHSNVCLAPYSVNWYHHTHWTSQTVGETTECSSCNQDLLMTSRKKKIILFCR